jgi:hypothetical protein
VKVLFRSCRIDVDPGKDHLVHGLFLDYFNHFE